ncbi:FAD-dependent oxidoreductase [Glacieibacterium frigidum]|uniref:FAD-dependent monooxygenase n=1 Tax=Glacieibacterium frigidum TaxID=2593303 RepID=A0A552U889_9SPHN|nr:FAD-dependent oxidoreductase [Glacieibacterium frigidum]TRW14435.1 FAD-dependent monooxygenase [Glacieibacterium frigidum]
MTVRTRVLVVGAGPVGAVAAYRLAEMGVDVVLIEASPDCPEDMRASTFHPPSLDMMEELGILDALLAQGLKAPIYQYRNRRSGNIIQLDLTEIADVTRHPFRLQCEQYKLARLLSDRLADHPHGQVLFNRRLLHIEQGAGGVVVHVEGPMAVERFECEYLVGADGANSTVRKWLDISFDGFTYPERFLTLSTAFPIEAHFTDLANVNYMADADEWCVLLRVPTLWRVLVPADAGETDAGLLSDAKKSRVFSGLVGDGAGVATYHRTLYRVHQRVAETFRRGRVLLVGDAAHLNNPLGGFGMNSGLHDAWNLTAKLRDILLDGAEPEERLSLYDRQRRTIASEFVQEQTIQNKAAMEALNGGGKTAQEIKLEALLGDDERRRTYLMRQAMILSLQREAEIV